MNLLGNQLDQLEEWVTRTAQISATAALIALGYLTILLLG